MKGKESVKNLAKSLNTALEHPGLLFCDLCFVLFCLWLHFQKLNFSPGRYNIVKNTVSRAGLHGIESQFPTYMCDPIYHNLNSVFLFLL